MKQTLTLLVVFAILISIFNLGDGNSMAFIDYEEMVRVISRGFSEISGAKDVAKDFFTISEATDFIAKLPVK